MDLSKEIAIVCEQACEDWNDADRIMSEPYARMQVGPIRQKEKAEAILKSHNLSSYNLPDFSTYPLLYSYMSKIKKFEEDKLRRQEEKIRIENSFEFQLKKRQNKIRDINLNTNVILILTN